MDYKSIVAENAWFGLNVDYGLLHLQLGTPVVTGFILLVLVICLNRLLFQPVLRTLEARKNLQGQQYERAEECKRSLHQLVQDYKNHVAEAHVRVATVIQAARQEAYLQQDSLIQQAKHLAEQEIQECQRLFAQEVIQVQQELIARIPQLVQATTQQIL